MGSVIDDKSLVAGGGDTYQQYYPWGEEKFGSSPNDRVKFATYRRDSESGLDYAWNRYYDNATGRILTPDRYQGSADPYNPQSWNRYGYGLGNPLGHNDPAGLCTDLIAGITMSPNDNSPFDKLDMTLGGVSVYPYSGLTDSFWNNLKQTGTGVASVFGQGVGGANTSTSVALASLLEVLNTTTGSIDVVAYSGGAQSFTTAFSELTGAQQARIGNILYISPGAVGTLAVTANHANTTIVIGSGPLDTGATAGTIFPTGAQVFTTNCGHTDLACLLASSGAQAKISQMAGDGPCPSQMIYTYPANGGGGPGGHATLYDPGGTVDTMWWGYVGFPSNWVPEI